VGWVPNGRDPDGRGFASAGPALRERRVLLCYTALGHFASTWLDPRFQNMLLNALLWLTGQVDGLHRLRGRGEASEGGSAMRWSRTRAARASYISLYGRQAGQRVTMQAIPPPVAVQIAGTEDSMSRPFAIRVVSFSCPDQRHSQPG